MSSEIRTFNVLLHRKTDVDRALQALAKRAARKRLTPQAWSWGKPITEKERVPHPEYGSSVEHHAMVTRVPLEIRGETPKYGGWRFAATLQHLEGANIVRALPGETVATIYRTRGSRCDHCKSDRRRNETFVLLHDDGRSIQVGRTCLGDFLGRDDAGTLAALASMHAEIAAIGEDGCSGMGNGSSNDRTLAEFLPYVAWCVRERGWLSRTKVRETGSGNSTADLAWSLLVDRKTRNDVKPEVSDDDRLQAESAATWAETLDDATVNAETGDYLHNLRTVAQSGLVESRTSGIAASMIVAWQRAVSRERERAAKAARPMLDAHLGEVGQKVTFGLPAEVGKRGKPRKGAPIVLDSRSVTLDFVTGYDTDYGYTTILKFRTDDGATLVWKASSTSLTRLDVGKRFTLYGTIKAHDDYKGAKQTILTRCAANEAV